MNILSDKYYPNYTKLPSYVITRQDTPANALIIKTPQSGEVTIEFIFHSSGFLSGTRTNKKTHEQIVREIYAVEKDARNFLLDEWIKKTSHA